MAWKPFTQYFPNTAYSRYRPRPWDYYPKVCEYDHPLPSRPSDDLYRTAIQKVRELFRLPAPVPVYHINDSINYFKHPDKSPGLPYTKFGIKKKRDVEPNVIKQYVHNVKYGYYTHCKTPCTAAARTMISKTGDKFRLIWVYPCHMTFAEGMFAQPLIKAYQERRGAYGLWICYARGDAKYLTSLKKGCKLLGLDWSAFDTRVPSWLIRDAFSILRENLDFRRYHEWGAPTDDYTLPRLWSHVIKYFIDTPIQLPSGKVLVKHQGVPSGSYFTNLVDSVCNAIVVHYCLLHQNVVMRHFWCLGDDSLVITPTSLSLDTLAGTAADVFGFKLNIDKSEFGEEVSFLGYHLRQGRPMADYDKLIGQLLCPADSDAYAEEFIVRARALQLSCFGLGCMRFTEEVQNFLDVVGVSKAPPWLHPRSEVRLKLEHLGLDTWPPLRQVMLAVC